MGKDLVFRIRDRISNLEEELLTLILSFLPTKDVVAFSLSSKTLMSHVFTLITSLDFDDSQHICHCLKRRKATECFPCFSKLVDSVLQKASRSNITNLPKFTLHLSNLIDVIEDLVVEDERGQRQECKKGFYPWMKLNEWICFPLTRNVRELDLSIKERKPVGWQLPRKTFTCQTLEVLKLAVPLDFDEFVSMPSFRLPNLKVLYLSSILFYSVNFVSRLISSCPSLEDLTVEHCIWFHEKSIVISSSSLRRLVFDMIDWIRSGVKTHEQDGSPSLVIQTPNLQYFKYCEDLRFQYSMSMDSVVEAEIIIKSYEYLNLSDYYRRMRSLIRGLSNAQRLSFTGFFYKGFEFDETRSLLPLFRNLNFLHMDFTPYPKAERLLLEFLTNSPSLETISICMTGRLGDELEDLCWREIQVIPSCLNQLKRVSIKSYTGWELQLVKFFLRNASILKELVIYPYRRPIIGPGIPCLGPPSEAEKVSFENRLKELPRASITCSIRVEW